MDASGFEELYRRDARAVRAYVRRRIADSEVDEVLAEVWLAAWRRRDALPADSLSWLYATARRVLANQRRGRSRLQALRARLAGERSPAMPGGLPDRQLAEALARLDDGDREALLLTAWEGLTPAAAAAALECSIGAFYTRVHRARERLRAELAEDEPLGAPTKTTQLEVQSCPRI